MRRHPALIPLSHDHQHALANALRLRRASGQAPSERLATAQAFVHFAEAELLPHFESEEQLLDRAALVLDDAAVLGARRLVVEEHARLRDRVAALCACIERGDVDAAVLHDTGRLLTAHVRFEERELFELLQERLADGELRALIS